MCSLRPSAEHPDAKLVIRSTSSTSLDLELHTADGATLAPFEPIHLEREPEKFFKELFSEIEGLPARYRTSQGAHRELEDLGAELSKRLLPLELGRYLAEITEDGGEHRTLWIQSDEPRIPWELLRLPSSGEDRGFQGPFLSEALAVARWLRVRPASGLLPHRCLPLRRLAVVAPHDRRLDSVAGEVAFLEKLGGETIVERIPADEDSVRRALSQEVYDAWHFSGHGLPHDEPARAEILFGNDQCLRARSLHAGMLESRRPLVFLNACHTGVTGLSLTGIGGWAEGFLSAGAGAFLGAYWGIEDAPAARFTEVFYTSFLGGLPVAAAVRQARLAIREEFPGDPTWLAYTLYAHPLAVRQVEAHPAAEAAPSPDTAPTRRAVDRQVRDGQPGEAPVRPRRKRSRLGIATAALVLLVALALLVGRAFLPSTPPAVAVLALFNETGSSEEDWRTVAVSEMLAASLGLDEKVRVVPGETAARSRSEIGLGRARHLEPDQTRRLYQHLGVPFLVYGSLGRTFSGGESRLEIRLRLHELPGGGVQASLPPLEGPDEQLAELIVGAARRLRAELGTGELAEDPRSRLEAVFPLDPEVLEPYVSGLVKLWRFDDRGARVELEKAAARAPEHGLVLVKLANAALNLNDLAGARAASRKAFDLRGRLPRRGQLEVEALFHKIHEEWGAAADAYQALWAEFPRDPEYGLLLAEARIDAGTAEAALETLEELRELELSELQEGEADLLEAEAHLALGDLETAREPVGRAVVRGAEIGARHLEARARFVEAEVFELAGEFRKARETLEKTKRLYETSPKNRAGVWTAFNRLAGVLYQQGDLRAAEEKFAEYREEYDRLGDPLGQALAQANLGIVLTKLGEYHRAEEVLAEALPHFTGLGLRYEAAVVANNLGTWHQLTGRLSVAKERYHEALATFEELGHRGDVALIRSNLGEIAFLEGDLAGARNLLESALAVHRELGDEIGAAYDLYQLGVVRTAAGSFQDARRAFDGALDMLPEGDVTGAKTTLALAELELSVKNLERARTLAGRAEQVFWESEVDDFAVLAQILGVRALLASAPADLDPVLEGARLARNHAESSEDPRVRVASTLLEARLALHGGTNDPPAAMFEALERLAEEIREVPWLFEVRLVQAEVEMASGLRDEAHARLEALMAEAAEKGFEPIAARARECLDWR